VKLGCCPFPTVLDLDCDAQAGTSPGPYVEGEMVKDRRVAGVLSADAGERGGHSVLALEAPCRLLLRKITDVAHAVVARDVWVSSVRSGGGKS